MDWIVTVKPLDFNNPIMVLFVSLIIRLFSLFFQPEQCFFLATNQPEQYFGLFFQRSEQDQSLFKGIQTVYISLKNTSIV